MEGMIVSDFGPTAAIINEKNVILYVHGKAGKYLEPTTGEFSGDILAMAREGLNLRWLRQSEKPQFKRPWSVRNICR
jgi:two-component system CheB/CheR fusion protein